MLASYAVVVRKAAVYATDTDGPPEYLVVMPEVFVCGIGHRLQCESYLDQAIRPIAARYQEVVEQALEWCGKNGYVMPDRAVYRLG